jgi:hypothetical protein
LFTNGIKVENAPPWHSAQVFVTDKPSLPPLQAELVMHASPSGDIKEETTGPTHVYFDTDSAPVGSIIDNSARMSHQGGFHGKTDEDQTGIQDMVELKCTTSIKEP